MNKFLAVIGFLVGCTAVVLQFAITIPARMAAGHGIPEAVLFFFSFFTILTNIAAILVYLSYLLPSRLNVFASHRTQATVAVSITLVGLIYAMVLAKIWAPQGLFWVCDILLHYIAPVVYVLWWALFARAGKLLWRDIKMMMVYPLAYLAYAIVRGQIMGTYPYPFIDIGLLGATKVAMNSIAVAIIFVIFSCIAIGYDRFTPVSKIGPRHP